MEMTVQSVLFSADILCPNRKLFFRSSGEVLAAACGMVLRQGADISTDTYMNLFDVGMWSSYTGVKSWKLILYIEGKGIIRLCFLSDDGVHVVSEETVDCTSLRKKVFSIPPDGRMYFFKLEATGKLELHKAYYAAEIKERKYVHISVIICTYQRNEQLLNNVKKIKESDFFRKGTSTYHDLDIQVVDNASELPERHEPYYELHHNPNTGGSGGFTRGILETRKLEQKYRTTHVVFMDDDVDFHMESFYRLYALLALVLPEYQDRVIAGRMFRMDAREIQYTASEVWNGGNILHVGGGRDMSDLRNLPCMNRGEGEYTGWWFGCFPMTFVRENLPLPFFLHCDDVEYGLRHGKSPVILNGIQVWHETYEYRKNPFIAYYDTRNSMIVNAMYGTSENMGQLFSGWRQRVRGYFGEKEFLSSYAATVALRDFLKGKEYFLKEAGKKQLVCSNRFRIVLSIAVLYMSGSIRCGVGGKKAVKSYQSIGRYNS